MALLDQVEKEGGDEGAGLLEGSLGNDGTVLGGAVEEGRREGDIAELDRL